MVTTKHKHMNANHWMSSEKCYTCQLFFQCAVVFLPHVSLLRTVSKFYPIASRLINNFTLVYVILCNNDEWQLTSAVNLSSGWCDAC